MQDVTDPNDKEPIFPGKSKTFPTTEEVIEEVSARVHDSWMDAKRAAGVTSRKLESGEELMVPYDQLSEAAKELDRGTVKSVLTSLPALGYIIVKR